MFKTKIINLFAGPGVGKSTLAAGLFHELKKRDISCDAPYEFPKSLAWNNSIEEIRDQLYVIANQHRGIVRSFGKVEYIIMDSPILLSLIYKNNYTNEYPANLYNENFDKMMIEIHNNYENINYVLSRPQRSHEDEGRFHNLEDSIDIDKKIIKLLNNNKIDYNHYTIQEDTINSILRDLKLN